MLVFLNILFITIYALLLLTMTLLPNYTYTVNVISIKISQGKLSQSVLHFFDK